MARKPRLHIPGGIYHVILRGNARAGVFFDPADHACSSRRAYHGRFLVSFLHTEPVLRLFDSDPAGAGRHDPAFAGALAGQCSAVVQA